MFTRSSVHIKSIYNYMDAVDRERSIVPIRGSTLKPIGQRRDKHMKILKYEDGSIACRLFDTDVVTFKPDGHIVVQFNGWASVSSAEFAQAVLGVRFWLLDNKVWCMAAHEDSFGSFPLDANGSNFLYRNGSGDLMILSPRAHVKHKINRVGANNVRKRYADFRAYVDRTIRLRANEKGLVLIADKELVDMFGPAIEGKHLPKLPPPLWFGPNYKTEQKTYADFQVLIDKYGDEDKTQDFYRAFLWLASSTESHRRTGFVTMKGMLKELDGLIYFFHRDEAFDVIECFGQAVKDPYVKFFSQPHD